MTSVYLHIPFCERICNYCDFPKRVSKTQDIDRYLEALEKEIQLRSVPQLIDTLFIGGGTPSILNHNQLTKLERILSHFHFVKNYEFSIECNPEHISEANIKTYKQMGVNRISLGVQTINARLLTLLNRGHNKENVIDAVELLRRNQIDNISMDFIFAIPFQTEQNLFKDLEFIKEINVPHISYYSLILEEKTVFHKMIREGKIELLDNETEAKMYEIILKRMKSFGYQHYEISNYAKSGYESRHNKVYWQNKNYYGFGMGASGYLHHVRYYNENYVNRYIEKVNRGEFPITHEDQITIEDEVKEAFLLGLRLIDGISINEINKRYHINPLEYFKKELSELTSKGWLQIQNDQIKLTHEGLFYGNEVFEKFI